MILHDLSIKDLEELINDAKKEVKRKEAGLRELGEAEYKAIYKNYVGKFFRLNESCRPDETFCCSVLDVHSEERDYAGEFDPTYTVRQVWLTDEDFVVGFDYINLSSFLSEDPEWNYEEITEEDYSELVNSIFDKAKERESTIFNTLKE